MINVEFSKYKKTIILFLLFVVVDVIAPLIFNVMGIPLNSFMVYLIWLNAMLIIYIILPEKVGTAFYD